VRRRAAGEGARERMLDRSSFLGWMRRARGATAALAVAITSVAACGCQTTQERSAELERAGKHKLLAAKGVSVTKESAQVRVVRSTLIQSGSSTAVAVQLRDVSAQALRDAPIELTVKDAKGAILYQNNTPGLQPSLTKVSLLEAGKEAVWVDDQVQSTGTPVSATALVGEATAAAAGSRSPGAPGAPKMSVVGAHLSSEGGAEATESGSVANRSAVAQANLVVYAVARRAGKIVAAGRAVLPEVAAGTSGPFQIYFVGNPQGAQIEVSVPATSF
jgi:hypothetical protein